MVNRLRPPTEYTPLTPLASRTETNCVAAQAAAVVAAPFRRASGSACWEREAQRGVPGIDHQRTPCPASPPLSCMDQLRPPPPPDLGKMNVALFSRDPNECAHARRPRPRQENKTLATLATHAPFLVLQLVCGVRPLVWREPGAHRLSPPPLCFLDDDND